MATSPTPSLESLPGATHSIGSFGEHHDYLSDSPLTLSGSSPPVSDSAICDDFSSSGGTSSLESHQTNSSSSASSTSSTSGLSCNSSNSAGVIGSGLLNNKTSASNGNNSQNQTQQLQQQQQQQQQQQLQSTQPLLSSSVINITGTPAPRCTGCKSKQSDAVAKCIDCANYLCASCVTAHQFMHCFDGHNVFHINNSNGNNGSSEGNNSPTSSLLNGNSGNGGGLDCLSGLANLNLNTNSISMLLQQHNNNQQPQSQLSKLIANGSIGHSTTNGFDGQSIKARFNFDTNDLLPKLAFNSLNGSNGTNDLLSSVLHGSTKLTSQYFCTKHKNELLKFFCRTCQLPVCKDCVVLEHPAGLHECEHIQDANPKQIENLLQSLTDLRNKLNELRTVIKSSEQNTQRIQMHYHKAQDEINETWQFFRSTLDERKQELLKELESFYNARTVSNSVLISKSQENIEKISQACDSVERFTKSTGVTETVMLKKMLDSKMQLCVQLVQELQSNPDLAFISNYQAIQAGVRNTFGYIRSSDILPAVKQPPIARPTNGIGSSTSPTSSNGSLNQLPISNLLTPMLERQFTSNQLNGNSIGLSDRFDSNSIISKRFNSANSLGPFVSDVNLQLNPYEKWSNGGSDNLFQNITDQYQLPIGSSQSNSLSSNNQLVNSSVVLNSNVSQNATSTETILDITSKLLSTSGFPPKSQIKRQKMIYHCKFGEFGVLEGQFTEPSGVAVNAQNDIVVADTNNHRIQIFDKEGRFKFQFGECGKRDGQLLYPNRVAVVKTSGDIVVTERSPTHQIQIYNQYGQFQRKFGANILQHPRGVTVDNKGRIVVVECKVMRVIIFDQYGVVLQKFGCSKHLEFPNGVVVNDKQEIFISDNRAHCVKVFNYDGQFLRQIGGEGITNYPIGVGINSAGEILIADNHNNFNLTIFTQDGQLVSALESKVKHAQCFDVALMDDGSVVLASKDYRLYIYRYVQVPPIGL